MLVGEENLHTDLMPVLILLKFRSNVSHSHIILGSIAPLLGIYVVVRGKVIVKVVDP